MHEDSDHLFTKSAKWPRWPLIPLGAFMALSGCKTVPVDYTLVLSDGVLYVCVDARKNRDECHKVSDLPSEPKSTSTPQ